MIGRHATYAVIFGALAAGFYITRHPVTGIHPALSFAAFTVSFGMCVWFTIGVYVATREATRRRPFTFPTGTVRAPKGTVVKLYSDDRGTPPAVTNSESLTFTLWDSPIGGELLATGHIAGDAPTHPYDWAKEAA